MRAILLSVLSSVWLLGANDVHNIVSEVAKLRQKYEECRQGQSIIKGIDPKVYEQCRLQRKADAKELTILYKRIAELEQKLRIAESRIAAQSKSVTKTTASDLLKTQGTSAIQSRIKTTAPASSTEVVQTVKKKNSAFAYRMNRDALIYDAPNGSVVENWENQRSFTAGEPSDGWIKITGYFVNRVWQSVRDDENLWVKENDTIRR